MERYGTYHTYCFVHCAQFRLGVMRDIKLQSRPCEIALASCQWLKAPSHLSIKEAFLFELCSKSQVQELLWSTSDKGCSFIRGHTLCVQASLTHAQSCSLCVKPVHKPHSKMSQHKSIETPSLSIGFFHGVKC